MDCGISPEDFWKYSLLEINDLIQSYSRKKLKNIKRQIQHDFIMAQVKTRYIFKEKDSDIPHPWEYYPEMFADEQKLHEKIVEDNSLEEYKSKKKAYIEEFNRRRQLG